MHAWCIGASFCYARSAAAPFQAQEVRAFGLLLADMVARLAPGGPSAGGAALGGVLGALAGECLAAPPAERPTFKHLAARLQALVEVCVLACMCALAQAVGCHSKCACRGAASVL